nr:hypothetical protein [Tanacetum cinerariifolium]
MAKKNVEPQAEAEAEAVKARNFLSQDEELLLAKCFIQISEYPKIGLDKKHATFWYKILEVYNDEAAKRNFSIRTKNMLTGKWTPMNREIAKFNSSVLETRVMSEENDENWMTLVEILYRTHMGSDFKHKSAWSFLKDKHKCSGSNPTIFQEMLQQQYELDRKEKIERIDREVNSQVALYDSQKVDEDLKVLQTLTDRMDPIGAAIINAQKARVWALYQQQN